MSRRYTYSTCLNWGGDVPTAEIEVTVSFTVSPGSPESGRFGPPELYDPGSPAEVEDIRVESIDGRSVEQSPGLLIPILEKLEDLHDELRDAMLAEAAERDVADADEAADFARRSRIDDALTGAA
ncbi:hypothetical protein [Phenylobacterium conjunctum]|uniref:Uncharacterized protein n=1 Tax=Phenylobacterium conjunctum TaxID=1298959 RepID=A0ABW3T0F8_9CAUL